MPPLPLDFAAGIQRDGTRFSSQRALDGLWCRWRMQRPRKIKGYVANTSSINGIPRKIHCFYTGGNVIIHVGHKSGVQQFILDTNGKILSSSDRTPATFLGGVNVGWTFDANFDTTHGVVQLVAHSVPDLQTLGATSQTVPFNGQIDSSTPLAAFANPSAPSPGVWTKPNLAGGVFCVQPYLFGFDQHGFVQWSAPNLPAYLGVSGGSSGAGNARVSAQAIVAGMPLRGGGVNSPAGLLWSLSELIAFTYVGASSGTWAFNTISPSSSILSRYCVIEYDGLYFWVGIDRFLVYNGSVNEVKNEQNQDWFFENLTPGEEGKTFAHKVPHFGEIWFCAAMFGNTEPSHAVIYNIRDNVWYDTELPDGGRSAGFFAQGFKYPFMGGATIDPGTSGYKLWMHEFGVDRVDNSLPDPTTQAIRSYFETPYIGGPANATPSDNAISVGQLEPDIVQVGDIESYILGSANNRAIENEGVMSPIKDVWSIPQEQFASFKETHRLIRFHIESNVVGGNYIIGRNLVHAQDGGDIRKFS